MLDVFMHSHLGKGAAAFDYLTSYGEQIVRTTYQKVPLWTKNFPADLLE